MRRGVEVLFFVFSGINFLRGMRVKNSKFVISIGNRKEIKYERGIKKTADFNHQ